MNHFALPEFWQSYRRLPQDVRALADRNFDLLRADSFHPSLHFRSAGRYWSVRIGLHYRALAVRDGDDVIWFWIGSHAEYDRKLR
ncbi:MAG: hypothetical protein Q8Q62_01500 [Mesorhizobium sp.]|nr:hypothetical protein [Mesorhizobium sp.]